MMLFHSKYAFAIPVNSGKFSCTYLVPYIVPCSTLQHIADRGVLKIHFEFHTVNLKKK